MLLKINKINIIQIVVVLMIIIMMGGNSVCQASEFQKRTEIGDKEDDIVQDLYSFNHILNDRPEIQNYSKEDYMLELYLECKKLQLIFCFEKNFMFYETNRTALYLEMHKDKWWNGINYDPSKSLWKFFLGNIGFQNCKYQKSYYCRMLYKDAGGKKNFKFLGSWLFKPYYFVLQPASTFFSFISGTMMVIMFIKYIRMNRLYSKYVDDKYHDHDVNITKYEYNYWFYGVYFTWILTFYSASLFHTFGILWFEYLDYLTVMLAMIWGVLAAIITNFQISSKIVKGLLVCLLVIFYMSHCYYMIFIDFYYTYNMNLSIFISILHASTWYIGSIKEFLKRKSSNTLFVFKQDYSSADYSHNSNLILHNGFYYQLVSHILLFSFAMFEIFDFPPLYDTFDGHSLWHFFGTTVFYFWCLWHLYDVQYHYYSKYSITKESIIKYNQSNKSN
eukprot:TRINITY_DN2919_c0_g3_i1.p1 TRINITY_DN2919_c0_g3~~TRINITY_DN2919_c0_g3_i1.p1  ORF type:complete len:446 (+),score=33.35 TRINITY_DN2919_c0_g3_i1:86-1423(+)